MDAQQESSRRPRRLVPAILAGLATALVLAGCSAGQNTQTDGTEPDVNGSMGQVGQLAIRDARFAYPGGKSYSADSTATLILTIVNISPVTDDELVDVSSPVSDDIQITGDKTIPGRRSLLVGTPGQANDPPTQSSVGTSTSTPTSGSSSATATPTATSSAAPTLGHATITLKQLKMELLPGHTYEVTFQFRNAGTVKVQLPIGTPTTPRPEPTVPAGNG